MNKTLLLCAAFAWGAAGAMPPQAAPAKAPDAPEKLELQGPGGGWRHSSLQGDDAHYTAAYPKPPVDRGAQRYRTLIEGRIAAYKTQRQPWTLVVNGNAMPLYPDESGRFARPYAFGQGSNSVELRDHGGGSRRKIQFYEADRGKTQAKLRAILTWDDPKAEVDLHVITPSGEHAFWARPLLSVGGGLDVDSVDGAGPEIFSSVSPEHGTWLFYINYWGNFNEAGYNFDPEAHEQTLITTRLSLIYNENTPNEKVERFVIPLRRVGELTFARGIQQ